MRITTHCLVIWRSVGQLPTAILSRVYTLVQGRPERVYIFVSFLTLVVASPFCSIAPSSSFSCLPLKRHPLLRLLCVNRLWSSKADSHALGGHMHYSAGGCSTHIAPICFLLCHSWTENICADMCPTLHQRIYINACVCVFSDLLHWRCAGELIQHTSIAYTLKDCLHPNQLSTWEAIHLVGEGRGHRLIYIQFMAHSIPDDMSHLASKRHSTWLVV